MKPRRGHHRLGTETVETGPFKEREASRHAHHNIWVCAFTSARPSDGPWSLSRARQAARSPASTIALLLLFFSGAAIVAALLKPQRRRSSRGFVGVLGTYARRTIPSPSSKRDRLERRRDVRADGKRERVRAWRASAARMSAGHRARGDGRRYSSGPGGDVLVADQQRGRRRRRCHASRALEYGARAPSRSASRRVCVPLVTRAAAAPLAQESSPAAEASRRVLDDAARVASSVPTTTAATGRARTTHPDARGVSADRSARARAGARRVTVSLVAQYRAAALDREEQFRRRPARRRPRARARAKPPGRQRRPRAVSARAPARCRRSLGAALEAAGAALAGERAGKESCRFHVTTRSAPGRTRAKAAVSSGQRAAERRATGSKGASSRSAAPPGEAARRDMLHSRRPGGAVPAARAEECSTTRWEPAASGVTKKRRRSGVSAFRRQLRRERSAGVVL